MNEGKAAAMRRSGVCAVGPRFSARRPSGARKDSTGKSRRIAIRKRPSETRVGPEEARARGSRPTTKRPSQPRPRRGPSQQPGLARSRGVGRRERASVFDPRCALPPFGAPPGRRGSSRGSAQKRPAHGAEGCPWHRSRCSGPTPEGNHPHLPTQPRETPRCRAPADRRPAPYEASAAPATRATSATHGRESPHHGARRCDTGPAHRQPPGVETRSQDVEDLAALCLQPERKRLPRLAFGPAEWS